MNSIVVGNYARLRLSLFFLPLFMLAGIALFLAYKGALNTESYIEVQRDWFYLINSKLSQFPDLEYNLTQIGDAMIFLSILSIFVVLAPKMWEALLSASLFSLLFSALLKKLFSVPRPAAAFDNSTFTIIGKTLKGHNSLPSGHSITVFMILTVLMFSFMPKKTGSRMLWCSAIIIVGLFLASSRVAVGAHFPLDVITGSILGYISGLAGIFFSRKYHIWSWIGNRKSYPFFILLFLVCGVILIKKIAEDNLVIFYLSLICLMASLYVITKIYVKNFHIKK